MGVGVGGGVIVERGSMQGLQDVRRLLFHSVIEKVHKTQFVQDGHAETGI